MLVYLICGQMIFLYSTSAAGDSLYDQYCEDMQGPLDASAEDYLAHAREKALGNQEKGQLLSALDRVERRVDALRRRAEEGGYEPWMVRELSYSIAYGTESVYLQRSNAALAVLLTALLTAPLWAYERQAGVVPMARSAARGRRGLFRRKAAIAALLSGFVWACVYLRELLYFLREHPCPAPLEAAVQNVDALAGFPVTVTFAQYMAILYLLRLLTLIGVGEASMALGMACSSVITAYAASALTLGLPALLAAMGAEAFTWVSPLIPVSSAELLWAMGGGRRTRLEIFYHEGFTNGRDYDKLTKKVGRPTAKRGPFLLCYALHNRMGRSVQRRKPYEETDISDVHGPVPDAVGCAHGVRGGGGGRPL